MKTHYEPHPVTPERKAELRKAGFKIIDAAFAPKGWQADGTQAEEKTEAETLPAPIAVKRGRKPKAAQ